MNGFRSNGSIYYLHTDHLGRPLRAANEANSFTVWSADDRPWETAPQSVYVDVNLRFPGQYYDSESGLYYNYFRYYDPLSGRYISSDPIGLAGGINRFVYANSNPSGFIDPFGLNVYRPDLAQQDRIRRVAEGRMTMEQADQLLRCEAAAQPKTAAVTLAGVAAVGTLVLPGLVEDAVLTSVLGRLLGGIFRGSRAAKVVDDVPNGTPKITEPYKRPSGATTQAQRDSVQGQPCVKCGDVPDRNVAGHKKALVEEYYETGTIDQQRMRSLDAVRPECPTCSAREGAEMSRYSRKMKDELGL